MLDTVLASLGLAALVLAVAAAGGLLALHLAAWAIVRLLGVGDD